MIGLAPPSSLLFVIKITNVCRRKKIRCICVRAQYHAIRLYDKTATTSNIHTFLRWSTHRLIKPFLLLFVCVCEFFSFFRAHSEQTTLKIRTEHAEYDRTETFHSFQYPIFSTSISIHFVPTASKCSQILKTVLHEMKIWFLKCTDIVCVGAFCSSENH